MASNRITSAVLSISAALQNFATTAALNMPTYFCAITVWFVFCIVFIAETV